MAECAAIPSCTNLQLQHFWPKKYPFIRGDSYATALKRVRSFAKLHVLNQSPLPKVHVVSTPLRTHSDGYLCLKKSSCRFCCSGMLTNPETLVSQSWVPVADQLLLMASIVFAHMAGVIPHSRTFPQSRSNTMDQESSSANPTSYGRWHKGDTKTDSKDCWSKVKVKLADAINAPMHENNLNSRVLQYETISKKGPLSLFALAEGSRLQLLWATLEQLQREVTDISEVHQAVDREGWLVISSEVIRQSIHPVCMKWLKEELTVRIEEPDEKLMSIMCWMLKGDERIIQDISRLGKAELYADMLFFLRYGYLRVGCCYNTKLLNGHGVEILEDLVIMLADGIANAYLELISVDSSMSKECNSLGLTLCSLSTRAIQRLRNEVALNRWVQENFDSVVSMYEDRFDLYVICRESREDPVDSQAEKLTWWKMLVFWNSAKPSMLEHVQIIPSSLPVKRTRELIALTGWRYYFSLFLEFSDISMPFVRAVFTKVSDAISFFLVCLIGRSLGLIYRGIRQSLGWRYLIFNQDLIFASSCYRELESAVGNDRCKRVVPWDSPSSFLLWGKEIKLNPSPCRLIDPCSPVLMIMLPGFKPDIDHPRGLSQKCVHLLLALYSFP